MREGIHKRPGPGRTPAGVKRHRPLVTALVAVMSIACVPAYEGEPRRTIDQTRQPNQFEGATGATTPDAGHAVPLDAGLASADAGILTPLTDAGHVSPDAGTAAQPDAVVATRWTDIEPIMGRACSTCHGTTLALGAPMPLVTYSDMMRPAPSNPNRRVHELVAERMSPSSGRSPMPPSGFLAASEVDMVRRWSAAGAP